MPTIYSYPHLHSYNNHRTLGFPKNHSTPLLVDTSEREHKIHKPIRIKSSSAPVTPSERTTHSPPVNSKFVRKRQVFQPTGNKSDYNFENGTCLSDNTNLARITRVVNTLSKDFLGLQLEINGVETGMLFKDPCKIKVEYVDCNCKTMVKVSRLIKEGLFWDTVEDYLIEVPEKNAEMWIHSEGSLGVTKLVDETGLFQLDGIKDKAGNFKGYALQMNIFDGASDTGLLFKSGYINIEYCDKNKEKVAIKHSIPGLLKVTSRTYYLKTPKVGSKLWILC